MRETFSANTRNEGTVHTERRCNTYADLVGTNELAALLGVTPRTIGNLIKRSRIPVLKVGSLNRFNVQRVLETLERKEAR
jgi:excisionase family DNA binding protein